MKTTLNKIREQSPCADGWKKLLAHLGKTSADDEPLGIVTILDSNGLEEALWCLRAVQGRDRELRLYAVWCARQVQHLMRDPRSIAALDVAERFANGEATEKELTAAWAAACDAGSDAGSDAAAAACDAALAAGRYAACDAAWAAAAAACDATAAPRAAAWAAAWAAAGAAGWAAAGAAQERRLRELCEECTIATSGKTDMIGRGEI